MVRRLNASRRALLTAAWPAVWAATLAGPWLAAQAHGDWPPRHGGVMNDGETSFEMVVTLRQVTFYLSDHGAPMATAGARGTLTLVRQGVTRQIPLAVAGPDSLKAVLADRLQPGDSLLARVTMGNGSIEAARFVVK